MGFLFGIPPSESDNEQSCKNEKQTDEPEEPFNKRDTDCLFVRAELLHTRAAPAVKFSSPDDIADSYPNDKGNAAQ
ncbi:hypothetical protein [Pedobacter insulae]|uniref:Uncharacterized protein n=1 Tax=Pedobacter insulae TaxID=414048 RepID=A0A1I2ZIM8_9SPHI|nr:hypothetical protein [Pedobacter insulae]SFH37349.1 hypothetical protein SAMN04489864_11038 [Pedobacter insulae]